ncbi:MAG: hypothetical protein MUO64_00170 [Anaerolineales bacterium]|nr:hypothetical protein [Anaerolineales bacterium]
MSERVLFGDVLETIDQLPLEDQQALAEVLQRRIIERRREEILSEILSARNEYKNGSSKPIDVDDLMTEILS